MPSRISRVVGKAKEDTATVLTTGQRWESLRAGFWGGLNHPELAIDCRNRANEYEAALTNHLNNQKRGRYFYPNFLVSSSTAAIKCQQVFGIRKPTDWGVGTPYQQLYIAIMNALQTPTDHKAYIYQECRFGGVKDRSSMVRMPRPMFAHLGTIARQNNSDISTVIRQAVYEYLQARGFKPFTQL